MERWQKKHYIAISRFHLAFCLREKFYAAGILDKNKTLVDFAMSNVEKFQKKDFNEKIGEM